VADLVQDALDAWSDFQSLGDGTPEKQAALVRLEQANAARDSGGVSGGGNVQSAGDMAQENYYNNLRNEERTSAKAFLNTLLTQYNMQSLAGQIESLIQQSTNHDFLAEKIRETAEYKTRFKGLIDLQARGITDVRNEGEYLRLRITVPPSVP